MRRGLSRHGNKSSGNYFNPASLFAAGEQGAWYDPSDLPTLFQDSAGTTPVTAVEQPVGLVLDKSKGLVLGSELVTNGTFTSTSGWTAEPGAGVTLSAANNVLTITQTGGTLYGRAYQALSGLTVGQFYQYTAQVASNPGSLNVQIWAHTGFTGTPAAAQYSAATSSTGNLVVRFQATATTMYVVMWFNTTAAGSVGFANASVKALPGNHAYQTTSASRPTLRARYNLLTYSEDQSNGVWVNYNATQQSNVAVAPDGTNTADRIVETSGAALQARYQGIAGGLSIQYTFSIYAKADQRSVVNLSYSGSGGANWFAATFDLTGNGQVTKTGAGASGTYTSSSITPVGNGWYRCQITGNTNQASGHFAYVGPSDTTNPTYGGFGVLTYTGNTSNGILVWGAQLTQTAVFPSNTYQRIAAATDYATGAAFPPYLFFDGVDDSLLTNSVDFSATDKMTVWAGVTKSAETTFGMIAELSAVDTNAGIFYLGIPNAAQKYEFASRGTATAYAGSASTYPPPISNVLTGIGNISGPASTLRINGTQVANITTSQGTGNYGNYPLYIGRRNNATLPLNGNIYSLIIRGAQSTAAQISSTESWVAAKTPLGTL